MIWVYFILIYILVVFLNIGMAYLSWIYKRPNDFTLGEFRNYIDYYSTLPPILIMLIPICNVIVLFITFYVTICDILDSTTIRNTRIR